MSGVTYPFAERYAPLFRSASRKSGGPEVAFKVAFQEVESLRLVAEGKLRRALTKHWLNDPPNVNSLRPRDVLADFETYAEVTYRAIGS